MKNPKELQELLTDFREKTKKEGYTIEIINEFVTKSLNVMPPELRVEFVNTLRKISNVKVLEVSEIPSDEQLKSKEFVDLLFETADSEVKIKN